MAESLTEVEVPLNIPYRRIIGMKMELSHYLILSIIITGIKTAVKGTGLIFQILRGPRKLDIFYTNG